MLKLGCENPYINYKRNQILFHENSDPLGVYFIKHGKIKTFTKDLNGKERIQFYATSGYFLGLSAVLNNGKHQATAVAVEKSNILFIQKLDFLKIIDQLPLVNQQILTSLNNQLDQAENIIKHAESYSILQKIESTLIILYKINKNKKEISITNQDLAKLIGTSSEKIMGYLIQLQNDKLIEIKSKSICILNVNELEKKYNFISKTKNI